MSVALDYVSELGSGVKANCWSLAEADEALRVSEASYRAIFDAAEDAIFVIDIETVGTPWEEHDQYVREYLIKGLSEAEAEEEKRRGGLSPFRGRIVAIGKDADVLPKKLFQPLTGKGPTAGVALIVAMVRPWKALVKLISTFLCGLPLAWW